MKLELVQSISHSQTQSNIRLFRNVYSGEGVMVAQEISKLMGYKHLGYVLKKEPLYQEGIHAFVLKGQNLNRFKSYLKQQCNIEDYRKSTRLLCIYERGISLLVGKYKKYQTLKDGGWIQQKIMPLLRKEFYGVYQAQIYLNPFADPLSVFLYQGRFVFLESQIATILNTEMLTPLYRGFYGYIEDIHFIFSPSKQVFGESKLLLCESGIYRYLHHNSPSIVRDFKEGWEKVLTKLYRCEIPWKKLILEKEDDLIDYCHEASRNFTHGETIGITKEEIETLLNGFQDKLQQKFSKEIRGIIARLDGFFAFYRKNFKKFFYHNQNLNTLNLVQLKEIAKQIGVFCSDKKTPHTVFIKALIEYTGIFSVAGLCVVLENFFSIHPGENIIELSNNTFKVWKS